MVSAEIRGVYTLYMEPLVEFCPPDAEDFTLVIRVMVGPRGAEGEESFDIKVCSSKWLAQQVNEEGFVWGRHYLFVDHFDPARIEKIITKFVERCSGETWEEVARKLGRLAYWEFEDYRSSSAEQYNTAEE